MPFSAPDRRSSRWRAAVPPAECPKNTIENFTMSQGAEKRYIFGSVQKVKQAHGGAQQSDGRLTNRKTPAAGRGWRLR